jgi:hypothetical protein
VGVIEEKSKLYGVAQQVIHDGDGSLSPKQRALNHCSCIAETRRGNRDDAHHETEFRLII